MLIWGATAAPVMNCVIGAITCSIEVLPIKIALLCHLAVLKLVSATVYSVKLVWFLTWQAVLRTWALCAHVQTCVCCSVTGECAFLLVLGVIMATTCWTWLLYTVVAYDPFRVHIACHTSNSRELLSFGRTVKVCGEKTVLWIVARLHRHSSAKCPHILCA